MLQSEEAKGGDGDSVQLLLCDKRLKERDAPPGYTLLPCPPATTLEEIRILCLEHQQKTISVETHGGFNCDENLKPVHKFTAGTMFRRMVILLCSIIVVIEALAFCLSKCYAGSYLFYCLIPLSLGNLYSVVESLCIMPKERNTLMRYLVSYLPAGYCFKLFKTRISLQGNNEHWG